jgi:hypothetical protein
MLLSASSALFSRGKMAVVVVVRLHVGTAAAAAAVFGGGVTYNSVKQKYPTFNVSDSRHRARHVAVVIVYVRKKS